VDFLWAAGSWREVAALRPEPGETCDQGVEYPGAERQEVEFACAGDVDQAGGFQFLDVMGERGRGFGQGGPDVGTAKGTVSLGDPLQKFKPRGICQGLQYGSAASTRKMGGFPGFGEGDGWCAHWK
jgi:hypothetical protein